MKTGKFPNKNYIMDALEIHPTKQVMRRKSHKIARHTGIVLSVKVWMALNLNNPPLAKG